MDFLYVGNAEESGLKYVLIITDDLSAYAWLLPYINPDSESAIDRLSKRIAPSEKRRR